MGSDADIGIPGEHGDEKIDAGRGKHRDETGKRIGVRILANHSKNLMIVSQRETVEFGLPEILGRGSGNLNNAAESINLVRATEKRCVGEKFIEETANRPNIHGRSVERGFKKEFRGAIPQCSDLSGEIEGATIGVSNGAKIGNFEFAFSI